MSAQEANYKKLIVYQKAKQLAVDIIRFFSKQKLSKTLEFVVIQLLRAIASIGANIAEGYGRYYQGNTRQFLSIARGSSYESDYWLEIMRETKMFNQKSLTDFNERNNEVSKMLTGLMKKIERTKS